MSLLANLTGPGSQQDHGRMWWVMLGALAAAQLFAFWLLCTHQVRKAEARQNEVTIQQMALADCLQYIPGSTIASCTSRADPRGPGAQPADNPALTGALPVSFSYR